MTADPTARAGGDIDPRLSLFLRSRTPVAVEHVTWPDGHEFQLESYFTSVMPPFELITSVRAIVVRDGGVLVFDDDVGPHVIPGGRVEPGESALVTLRRELREEIGCEISGDALLMGFIRFHHLGAEPPGYGYPYPDDLHLMYVVETSSDPRAGTEEKLVLAPRFVPLDAAATLALPVSERAFLDHPLLRK
jgi:8-oxo-dGTP pyrophosphatase MutT (NUDIX family)